jgi:hypothetical protein
VLVLTLFGRPDCHLCDEMIAELAPLVAGKARVEVVDISEDDDLIARYELRIPVLRCRDEEISHYRLERYSESP